MNFASDNVRGVAPPILHALAEGMGGAAAAYGADAVTGALEPLFADIFGCPVAVLPVATGGAMRRRTSPWTNAARRNSSPAAQN